MKTNSILLITALLVFAALAGASAQTPPPPQSGKPSAAQQKSEGAEHLPEGVHHLSGAAADNVVLMSTGKTGIDKATAREPKAAVIAQQEKDAAASQAVSEGEAYFKGGNTHLAIDFYKAALDITPNDGLAYRRLAEAYTATGKLDEASQAFHKFLVEGFGPGNGNGGVVDDADEWAEYALVLVKTGQPAEAIRCYNHAASLLDYEGSKDNGGKPFLKVLFPEVVMGDALPDQVPYTPEHLQALADSLLAYRQGGFWSAQKIVAHTQAAAKLYPDSAVIQYYLGEALAGTYYHTVEHSAQDKVAMTAAYKKAIELGDDKIVAAAKERLSMYP